jgi:hypothetical protein
MFERLENEQDCLNQMMISGDENFSDMTLKPRGRVRNGTFHNLHNRK